MIRRFAAVLYRSATLFHNHTTDLSVAHDAPYIKNHAC